MTSLVTGASGFVGRQVVENLLAAGGSVRALVRDPAMAALLRSMGADLVTGDMRDPYLLREAVRGVDVVYHCAAAIGQAPKFQPRDIFSINLTAARNLLEAVCQSCGGRVVLLSSVNVLGTRHLDHATEEVPCRRSGDPSADVKIDIEALAWKYQRRHGLDVVVLRPGVIYGPRDRVNLPRLMTPLCKGRFTFIGSRDHVVPIVHVSDVAKAMLLAGQTHAASGRVYHITDGSRITIGEFVDYLAHLLGCPRPQRVVPYALPGLGCLFCEFIVGTGLGRFLDWAELYRAPPPITRGGLRFLGTSRSFDIRRARAELGYLPSMAYREGLADAFLWHREPGIRLHATSRFVAAFPEESTESKALRTRVEEVVCKHWVTPSPSQPLTPLAAAEAEKLCRTVLDTMLTRQFRVGRLPSPEVYDQLLERVRRRVRKGQPIRVTVGFGPLKNQHAVAYSRADWAEFFALCHLVAWHNKVQRVYPPGLQIQIGFDNWTLARANAADHRLMDSYMNSVADLIQVLGFESVLAFPAMQSTVAWFFNFGLNQLAERRVRRWEEDPSHREQLERMVGFARRNVVVPSGLNADEEERYLRRASHRFRVCWEAMQLSGLPGSKNHILAVYLDGSQHHFQGPQLHLTTIDKGQVTQPWQGEGVLLDNGHGGLEPFILTGERRSRHRTQMVEGLDLIPMPGFERMQVAFTAVEPKKCIFTEVAAIGGR